VCLWFIKIYFVKTQFYLQIMRAGQLHIYTTDDTHTRTYYYTHHIRRTKKLEICVLKYILSWQQYERPLLYSDAYCFALGRKWFIVSRFIVYICIGFSASLFQVLVFNFINATAVRSRRHYRYLPPIYRTVDFKTAFDNRAQKYIGFRGRPSFAFCSRTCVLVKNDFGFLFSVYIST